MNKQKIKTKYERTWDAHNVQVILNGIKYPKERGEWYRPSAETESDAKAKATKWAIAESNGKYLSSGGMIYNSKEEFLDLINN
jgi:hypothetical protein